MFENIFKDPINLLVFYAYFFDSKDFTALKYVTLRLIYHEFQVTISFAINDHGYL